MTKTILILWLLASRDNIVFLHAVKFDTEAQCQLAAEANQDPRKKRGDLLISYPVQKAECIEEVKK